LRVDIDADPATESIKTFESIQAHEEISEYREFMAALPPILSPKEVQSENTAKKAEVDYMDVVVYAWMFSPENGYSFWYILAFMILIVIIFLLCFIRNRPAGPVPSWRTDETKRSENLLQQLRGVESFMQTLEKRCAGLENYMQNLEVEQEVDQQLQEALESFTSISKSEHENGTEIPSENNSMKTKLNEVTIKNSVVQKDSESSETNENDQEPFEDSLKEIASIITKLEERCAALEDFKRESLEAENESGNHLQNDVESLRRKWNFVHEPGIQFQSRNDSKKTNENVAPKTYSLIQNEAGSTENFEEDEERRGDSHNNLNSLKAMLLKVVKEIRAEGQIEIDSIEIIEEKREHAPYSEQDVGTINTWKMNVGEEYLSQYPKKTKSMREMIEVEHEPQVEFQSKVKQINKMRKFENGNRAEFLNVVDFLHRHEGEYKSRVDSQNVPDGYIHKEDSVNKMCERLSAMLENYRTNTQIPMEATLTDKKHKDIYINSSAYPVETSMNWEFGKSRGDLAPLRMYNAINAKFHSERNKNLRNIETQKKRIHYPKPDYSKIKARVDSWRRPRNKLMLAWGSNLAAGPWQTV
jgi:hypothetical protein